MTCPQQPSASGKRIETLFRYNDKPRYEWYCERPQWLTDELYRDFRSQPPDGMSFMSTRGQDRRHPRNTPHGIRNLLPRLPRVSEAIDRL